MGLFERFPYTNFHDLNLTWILNELKTLEHTINEFVSINALKYADPIQWNITTQYEKNTIVIDPLTGTAYISVQPVPSGVALTNTDYWTVVFDLGSFVVKAAKNFCSRYEEATTLTATFPSSVNDWLIWGDTLYRAKVNITAGDSYVIDSNIEAFTVEDVVGHIQDLNTTDKSNLVAAINEVLQALLDTCGDLDNLATTDKSNLVAAINEVLQALLDTCGDLDNLTTTDKSSLVAAINELAGGFSGLYVHDITYNVPSADYPTVMDVVDYLASRILGENITIKVADGTYSGQMLNLVNRDLKSVSIIGNTTDPEACVIDMTGGGTAFYLSRSNLKLINGFKIKSTDRDGSGNWSSIPIGVFAHFYSNVNVGLSMLFEQMYYAIQSANGSQITMAAGETLTSPICGSLTKSNVFANRKGKNICAIESGDVAYFAYNGGALFMDAAIAMDAFDNAIGLGYGILSEHSSAIRAFNCFCSSCASGIGASDSSSFVAHNNNFLWNNGNGAECKENSSMEIVDADIYNSTYNGILCQRNSFILCRRANPNAGGSGFYATDGSFIKCDEDCTCNLVTGYGYFYDKTSLISDRAHMLGTTTGQILERGERMYASSTPITGNWSLGDVIYNTDPSNDIFCWVCVSAGTPGTWKSVIFSGGVVRFTFVRPASPVNGDTIYDTGRNKLTVYYNGLWIDASQSIDTFYNNDILTKGTVYFDDSDYSVRVYDGDRWHSSKSHGATSARPTLNLAAGEFYFDTTLGKPIWYNGSDWVDANGTVV